MAATCESEIGMFSKNDADTHPFERVTVVRHRPAVFELSAGKDEPLLAWRDDTHKKHKGGWGEAI